MSQENDMTTAEVYSIPPCDICKRMGIEEDATHDARTNLENGPWAYLCDEHFKEFGIGVGGGLGQRLIVKTEEAEAEEAPVYTGPKKPKDAYTEQLIAEDQDRYYTPRELREP